MKFLFWAAFILLLDVSVSQDVEVPCTTLKECQDMGNAPANVTCDNGLCKCNVDGIVKNCAFANKNSSTQDERVSAALIGRICSMNKDCDVADANSYCNTTRKQCVCQSNYVASLDNQRCLGAIQFNESGCEIPKQCLLAAGNTTCSDKVCLCDVNYHRASGACWATRGFGLECNATQECEHVKDAICDEQRRCGCPANRVISPDTKACLPVVSEIEDECIESIQCTMFLGDAGICLDHRCHCAENHHHHAANNASKCVPVVAMGAACQADADCFNGEEKTMRCLMNKCDCVEDYENREGKCEAKLHQGDKSLANKFGDVSVLALSLAYFVAIAMIL